MEINLEKTRLLQANPLYAEYMNWLLANGCVAPYTEYPVAFGEYGVIGMKATVDIPPRTDFLSVPYSLTINIKAALDSPVGPVFEDHPHWFSRHPCSGDHMLWLFLIYERCKGQDSKWFPYFATIPDIVILTDWSDEELAELEDPVLAFDARMWGRRMAKVWVGFEPILRDNPELFLPSHPLKEYFEWAWRLTSTRSFAWEGGMLVPLADNINHADCPISYEFKVREPFRIEPYDMPLLPRTNCNRLDKYLQFCQEIPELVSVWDLETLLKGYTSDSDDEAMRAYGDINSEDETDEEYNDDYRALDDLTGLHFVMTTDYTIKFQKNEQIFQAYGRLSNRELLIDYGFAMAANKYDTVYFRIWKPETGRIGWTSFDEICSEEYKRIYPKQTIEQLTEVYALKVNKLNADILEYFRRVLTHDQLNRLIGKSEIETKYPTNIAVELHTVEKTLDILYKLQTPFLTEIEADEQLLEQPGVDPKLRNAVIYRLAQKKIVQAQINFLKRLQIALEEVNPQFEIGFTREELTSLYPLLGYLRTLKTSLALEPRA